MTTSSSVSTDPIQYVLSSDGLRPFLLSVSYTGEEYKTLGLSDLRNVVTLPRFKDIVSYLEGLIMLSGVEEPAFDDVLTVRFGLDGELDAVFTPAVFASPERDKLLIRIGNNFAEVEQKEDKLSCGSFTSVSIFSEKQGSTTTYYRHYLRLRYASKGNQPVVYTLPILTEVGKDVSADTMQNTLESGNAVAALVRPVKLGGGSVYVKLRDLDLGDYLITRISVPKNSEYSRFNIHLEGGVIVSPNSKLLNLLAANEDTGLTINEINSLYSGKYLAILAKEDVEVGGKPVVKVTCDIKCKASNPVLAYAANPHLLKSASEEPSKNTLEATVLSSESLDEVPY